PRARHAARARPRSMSPPSSGPDRDARPSSPIVVGLRRVAELDLDAPIPPGNPELVARIADEIGTGGPMTFARFMELALYEPALGYYASGADAATGPGRAG